MNVISMNTDESILMAVDTDEASEDKYGLSMTVDFKAKTFMSICKSLDEVKENIIDNLVEEFKHLNLEKLEKLEYNTFYEKYKITYNVFDYDEYEWIQPWDLYDIFENVKLKLNLD